MLTQQRFTYLPDPPPSHGKSLQMRITAGGKAKTSRILLTEKDTTIPLPHDWESVLINEGGHGFYRVRYAPDLLDRLLNTGIDRLAVTERFNLINDAWATTVAGHMPLTDYLDLTARFTTDRDKNVWAVLLDSFSFLNRIITVEDRPALEALLRGRIGPAVTDLGWAPRSGESELTKQLRGELIGAQGKLGNDPAIQQRAAELYRAYRNDATAVDPNVVPSLVAILGIPATHQVRRIYERFRTAADTARGTALSPSSLAASNPRHCSNAHSPTPSAEKFAHTRRAVSCQRHPGHVWQRISLGLCENELGEDGPIIP